MPTISILAQARGTSGSLFTILWLAALIGLFYVLLVRPQRTRARRHQQLVASLEVGDQVQTIGGIYGIIRSLDDTSAVIEVEDGGILRVARRAIGTRVSQD